MHPGMGGELRAGGAAEAALRHRAGIAALSSLVVMGEIINAIARTGQQFFCNRNSF